MGLASEWRSEEGDRKSDIAAQNQSIRTNLVKAKVDKSPNDMLCYAMCKKADESVDHVVSGCSKLAQEEYKRRHDNLGKIVHWKLARKCNFEAGDEWYEHEPESVLSVKIIKYCGISVFRLIML